MKVIRCDFLLFMDVCYTMTLKKLIEDRIHFVKTFVSIYISGDPCYVRKKLIYVCVAPAVAGENTTCTGALLSLDIATRFHIRFYLFYSYIPFSFTKLTWLVVCVCVRSFILFFLLEYWRLNWISHMIC